NAEDPARNFAPSPGLIEELRLPGGPGVRIDSHAYAGYRIPPNYDSMIGKLIVHRPTRAEAIATMRRALSEFHISPIKTTIPLHHAVPAVVPRSLGVVEDPILRPVRRRREATVADAEDVLRRFEDRPVELLPRIRVHRVGVIVHPEHAELVGRLPRRTARVDD